MIKKRDIIIPILSILSTIVLGATVRRTVQLTSFNAGEISPLMNSRVDFAKYHTGAKTLQNMIVRAQGPVQRRPGTKYIASVKDANDPVRLIPFQYSTSDCYVIELGDLYARFYRNGEQIPISGSDANAYEIVTPWDANDLFELQFAQDAQYMRIVHDDYAPYKLTRSAHNSWTCTEITFTGGPFLDENETTSSTITPSATTGNITLSASASSMWDSDHVGALWQISHIIEANSVHGSWCLNWAPASNPVSDSLTVQKNRYYDFTTGANWNGTVRLQRSYDDGSTWEDVQVYYSYFNQNFQYSGQETEADAIYRCDLDDDYQRADRSYCVYNLTARSFKINGVVEITAVADANDANATVVTALGSTDATYRWAEGAWSTYRGFPRTVEHHEQRCVYGGSTSYPQTLWASIIATTDDTDYDDFTEGEGEADDPWTYQLPGMNPIQWLKSGTYLMVGTTASVGRLGSDTEAIAPTAAPIYRNQAKNGCSYLQPVDAVDAVLYVERGGQKIRELTYTYSSDRYVAPDMTILAEHITGDGILEIDFANRPDPILWCIRDDGVLLSFTYHRKHDIMAWGEHTTGSADDFTSVAVIPGTDEDVVYVATARTVDSNSVRYIENFQPYDWGTDNNDCWFVDAGVTDGNNLSHLEGLSVAVFNDARPGTAETVSGGAITASGHSNYVIGLPYTSIFETMPLVSDGSLSRKARVLSVMADFYETLGAHVGSSSTRCADLRFSTDSFATTIDPYTGIKVVPYVQGTTRDPTIYCQEADPVPLTIRGYTVDMEVTFE